MPKTSRSPRSRGFSPAAAYRVVMGDGLRQIDRLDGGVGWLAHPEEPLARASHALVVDGEVWVVDPVDAPGVDDLLADLGDVAGAVVGLDRHMRDAAAIANRHGVSVHFPRLLRGTADRLDAPTEVFDGELGDTGYRAITVVDNRFWREVALHDPTSGTLLVPEAVGTTRHYVVGRERLGVHPALRLRPPRRALSGLDPDRILVGHGAGVQANAGGAMADALRRARRNAPRLYLKALGGLLRGE